MILNLDRDLEVRAIFGTAIQPVVQGNGRVDIWPQRASHPYGSKVQLVAVADEGHVFGRWGQALKVTSSVLEMEVTQINPSVIALFAPLREGQLSLSVLLNGNGHVTLDPPRNLFKAGDQVTLTAKPLGQEVFSGWSGDAEGKGAGMVLTMDQSKTVTASFQQGKTPSITWDKPADIVYGTALGPLQFMAEAEVPGTLKYSPSSGTILPAGKRQPLRVQFTPIDSTTYSNTSVTVFLNVLNAPLQIVAEDKIRSLNQNNPTFSYKATGFVNGENAHVLKFPVTFQCSAVRSSPIAKYLITPRGAVADNYDITYVAGTLTIVRNVKDLVTLQIERKSKTLVNLIAKGTMGEMVVFESSTDLKRWQEIGTMPMTNGKAILSVPLTTPVQVFRGKR